MSSHSPITPSADLRGSIPDHPGTRLDRIAAAIVTLRAESVRFERLGLEGAFQRCRRQLRYWEFLRALFSLTPEHSAGRGRKA